MKTIKNIMCQNVMYNRGEVQKIGNDFLYEEEILPYFVVRAGECTRKKYLKKKSKK